MEFMRYRQEFSWMKLQWYVTGEDIWLDKGRVQLMMLFIPEGIYFIQNYIVKYCLIYMMIVIYMWSLMSLVVKDLVLILYH